MSLYVDGYPKVDDEHIDDIQDDTTNHGAELFMSWDMVSEHSDELVEASKRATSEDDRIWGCNWDAYANFNYHDEAKYQFEDHDLYNKQVTEDTIEAYNDAVGCISANIGHAMAQGLCNYLEVENCSCYGCTNNHDLDQ